MEQLRQQRAMAAMVEPPEDGKGGAKKKRKKGDKEDMTDFYVDDTQPIERLPKAKKTDEDVKVGAKPLRLLCSQIWAVYVPRHLGNWPLVLCAR